MLRQLSIVSPFLGSLKQSTGHVCNAFNYSLEKVMTTDNTEWVKAEITVVASRDDEVMGSPALVKQVSGRCVLLVLHASLCSCRHCSTSQHSQVHFGDRILFQSGQVLVLILWTLVQISPAGGTME